MTAEEKRIAVRNKYRTIIGRNKYSQNLRGYCYTKYSDGNYYSDCSSSISYTYRECKKDGVLDTDFGILNTVGMYQSKSLKEVPVEIVAGQIKNPEVLRIGDMLLYAGTDSSRAYAGYVGHVEMVGEIDGSKIVLYGHGSGNPKKVSMTEKNTSRYNSKTTTKLGHKGLIKVVRFIQDDSNGSNDQNSQNDEKEIKNGLKIKSGSWNIRQTPSVSGKSLGTVKCGTIVEQIIPDGWTPVKSGDIVGWISNKALEV